MVNWMIIRQIIYVKYITYIGGRSRYASGKLKEEPAHDDDDGWFEFDSTQTIHHYHAALMKVDIV